MYLLEHHVLSGAAPHANHRWVIYAFCGKAELLKKVCAAQPDAKNWRVVKNIGTCADALCCRDTQVYGKAG